MNQEEWLAERRRLGLPADPEKDFPPNFHRDPPPSNAGSGTGAAPGAGQGHEEEIRHQRARIAAALRAAHPHTSSRDLQDPDILDLYAIETDQTPPSAARPTPRPTPPASYPPPPRRKRGPARALFILLVVLLFMISGGVGFFSWASGLFRSLQLGGSSTGSVSVPWEEGSPEELDGAEDTFADDALSEDPTEGVDAAASAQAEAERLMNALAHGEKAAVAALVRTSSLTDSRLLTPATARAAMGKNASFTASETEVGGGTATVRGTLSTSSGDVPVTLQFSSAGEKWIPDPLDLPHVQVSSDAEVTARANGARLPLPTDAGRILLTWPGQLKITLPTDRYTTWKDKTLQQRFLTPLTTGGGGEEATLSATPVRTKAFLADAKQAALQNYARCLRSHVPAPEGCPFSAGVPNAVTQTRNVAFRELVPLKKWHLSGSFGSEMLWGTGGAVKITGQGYWEGSWGTLTGNLDVTSVGDVQVKKGKLVYTAR